MLGTSRPVGQGRDIGAIETDAANNATATVSSVTYTGFSVSLSPAIDGLDTANFHLDNDGNITAVATSDGGTNYSITTDTLTEDVTYTVTISGTGCQSINVVGDDILITATSENTNTINNNIPYFYPNPANDIVYINQPDNLRINKVTIFDITGKIVLIKENQMSSEVSLDISGLHGGIYTIQIQGPNFNYIGKLFVK